MCCKSHSHAGRGHHDELNVGQAEDSGPIKIVLIGDSGVGKSSIWLRFCDNFFQEGPVAPSNIDFKTKLLLVNHKPVQVQVYDTAGQERFRAITSSFYRGAHGIIVVYDITSQDSYNNVKNWLQEIKKYALDTVHKMIVGNKSDLEDQRVIHSLTAKRFADDQGLPFQEISAKSGAQVENAFHTLVDRILRPQASSSIPRI